MISAFPHFVAAYGWKRIFVASERYDSERVIKNPINRGSSSVGGTFVLHVRIRVYKGVAGSPL